MTPAEFSKALLQSAKELDVPANGAKARALGQLATSVAAAGAGAAGAGVAAATATASAASGAAGIKLGVFAWSIAASFAVAGAGGYAVARATSQGAAVSSHVAKPDPAIAQAAASPTTSLEASASRSAPTVVVAPGDAAGSPANACTMHTLPDTAATTCSRGGKNVHIDVRNGCAADVDIFWVDFKCEEVFHKRLAPGEAFLRGTQDGHVWRVRDHATHALLKEFVPKPVPGAPDFEHEAPTRALPDITLHANDAAAAEEKRPPVCSGAGMKSKFTVKNDRDEQVVLMWVGLDCEEKYWERIEAKHSRVVPGRDADAWRIRDAKTGALIMDIVPDVPDTTTYVTVP